MEEELQTIEPQIDQQKQEQDIATMEAVPDISGDVPMGEPTAGLFSTITKMIRPKVKPTGKESALLKKWGMYDDPKMKEQKRGMIELEKQIEAGEINKAPLKEETAPIPKEFQPIKKQKEELKLGYSNIEDYATTDSHQMNFDTIESPDDIKAIIAEMADNNKASINEKRRGVITDEQLYGLADDIGSDPEKLKKILTTEQGELLSAEYMIAARQMIERSAIKLKEYSVLKSEGKLSDKEKLSAARQLYFHQQLQQQFMGQRAEYGRGMRAMGIQTGLGRESEARAIEEKLASADMRMGLDQLLEDISAIDSTKDINRLLSSKTNWQKGFDSVYEVWVNSILSGIKTFKVNTVGNALRLGMDTIDQGVAVFMGKGQADKDMAISAKSFMHHELGKWSSTVDALKVGLNVAKTADQYKGMSKLDSDMLPAISSANYGMKADTTAASAIDFIGGVLRVPTERLMGGVDALFRRISEGAASHSVAYREASMIAEREGLDPAQARALMQELLDNPSQQMIRESAELADDVTFQRPLGEKGQRFNKVIRNTPALRYVIPFVKTPTNLLKQGFLERTPIGLASKKLRDDIMAGGARGQLAKSRMTTGTALGGLIWNAASEGLMTGTEPSDPALKKAWRDAKVKPRSFVFKNEDGTTEYVPYDRYEPLSYILGSIADLNNFLYGKKYDDLMDDEDALFEKSMGAIVTAVAENTLNKTFMTGIRDLMNVWSDPKRYGKRYIQNQMNAFIPFSAARRDLAKTQDPYLKVSSDAADYIQNNTPFITNANSRRVDAYGEQIQFHNILSPYETVVGTDDKTKLEVLRLANSINEYPFSLPSKMLEGVKLTPEQHNDLVLLSRKIITVKQLDGNSGLDQFLDGGESRELNFKGFVDMTMKSELYINANDNKKAIILQTIANAFDEAGRLQLKATNEDILRKTIQKKSIPLIKDKFGGESTEVQREMLKDETDYQFDKVKGGSETTTQDIFGEE